MKKSYLALFVMLAAGTYAFAQNSNIPSGGGGSGGGGGGAVTVADGADVTQGALADAAYAGGGGSASVISILKGIYNSSTGALPAGSAIIGSVRIDQTTPGTTNGVQDAATGTTAAAVPAKAQLAGARSGANIVELIQASASAAINVSTATTTQLVALSGSTKIYVTTFDVISAGTGNITFVYGTGASCGTGTTSLTGAYNLTAQAGIAKGSGLGPVLVVPAGNALCVTTSAAVQMSGSVAYTQF